MERNITLNVNRLSMCEVWLRNGFKGHQLQIFHQVVADASSQQFEECLGQNFKLSVVSKNVTINK